MPHHNTYRRILVHVVDPDACDGVVGTFLTHLPQTGTSIVAAFDGKTVRGTIDLDQPHGAHLLAASLPEEGIVMMQVAAGEKANEITVAPKLLACLDLRGNVVIGNAPYTRQHLSVQILEASGKLLEVVRENQPTLRADSVQGSPPKARP